MFKRRNCVVYSIVTYAILISSYFLLSKEKTINPPCSWDEPCIRFCCNESSSCKHKFIRETFNASLLPQTYEDENYTFLYGHPICNLEVVPADKPWHFFGNGKIYTADNYYEEYQYCFKESINEGKVDWNLLVCNKHNYTDVLCKITSIISALALFTTIAVYAFVKELKTVPGRCFLFFSISLFIVHVIFPFIYLETLISYQIVATMAFAAGFLFSFLWMSVLSFDIFWTFLKWQSSSDGIQLKYYCYYVFGVTLLFIIFILGDFIHSYKYRANFRLFFLTMVLLLCIIAVSDVIFLCSAAIQVFKISKSSTNWENSRFESEKDRFWTYLQLFGVMVLWLVTWPTEMVLGYDDLSIIISQILKCFSVLLIFAMFVLKKEVRVLIKLRSTSNMIERP